MDPGVIFFLAFIIFWIAFLRSRVKGASRPRLRRPPPLPSGPLNEPTYDVTLVGVEDFEEAVSGLAAITGESRSVAASRLRAFPSTLPVPIERYRATLELLAESGIAYATGSLGSFLDASPPAKRPPRAAPPDDQPDEPPHEPQDLASNTEPQETKTDDSDPDDSEPDDSEPDDSEPGEPMADTNRPRGLVADDIEPDALVANDPDEAGPSLPEPAEAPSWARLDPDGLPAEVLAATTEPDPRTAERTLRRLSMNGIKEADLALGILLADWGRHGEAEGFLRSAAREHGIAANNLGVLEEEEGMKTAARRSYTTAARLGNAEGKANLARLDRAEDR